MAMVTARVRELAMACVGGSGRPGRASAGDLLRCSAREGERKREASPRQRHFWLRHASGRDVASGAIVTVATGLEVATPGWVKKSFGTACERGVGAVALRRVEALHAMKTTKPLGLTFGHGVVTKVCADLLAQAKSRSHQSAGVAWIDPLQMFRSTMASMLDDGQVADVLYYWTRAPGALWCAKFQSLPRGLQVSLARAAGVQWEQQRSRQRRRKLQCRALPRAAVHLPRRLQLQLKTFLVK